MKNIHMINKFADKSISVLVITGPVDLRSVITGELKSAGFNDTRGVADIAGAIDVLQNEQIDWVITPIYPDEKLNGFHLLKLTQKYPLLRETRVSFLVKEDETHLVDSALAQGLLSWQPAASTKNDIKAGFEQLFQRFEMVNWSTCLASATYVRDSLIAENSFAELVKVEKTLIDLYPAESSMICYLAQAHILNGDTNTGLRLLAQAKKISSRLEPLIEQVKKRTNVEEMLDQVEGEVHNLLQLENVCVVHPETVILDTLKTIFENLGVTKVSAYRSPVEAWKYIDKNAVDFVVHAWQQPILPGSVFVQRIRKRHPAVPVMVFGMELTSEDDRLVSELGISYAYKEEPINEKVTQAIIYLVQQEKLPTDPKFVEAKIYQLVEAKQMDLATELKNSFLVNPKVSDTSKKKVEGFFAFKQHDYMKALSLYVDVLKTDNINVSILHSIGKCLIQMQKFEAALQCFENAQSLSPYSIDRLCEIATAQVESGNGEKAQKAIKEAKMLDSDSATIAETEAEIAIINGDPDAAKKLMEQMSSISGILAFLNNRGVALTRCERLTEGVMMYNQALEAIPKGKDAEKSIILYNQALGLIRSGEYTKSLAVLKACVDLKEPKVQKKAVSLYKRLSVSIKENKVFKLNAASFEAIDPDEDAPLNPENRDSAIASFKETLNQIQENLKVRKGTMCCLKIFFTTSSAKEANKLMDGAPVLKKLTDSKET